MSKNITYPGPTVSIRLYTNASYHSGDLVTFVATNGLANFATISGVAENDEDALGYTVVRLPFVVAAKFDVHAVDDQGDSAVAIGDILVVKGLDGSSEIDKDLVAGVIFGVALGAVAAGATEEINVGFVPMLIPSDMGPQ